MTTKLLLLLPLLAGSSFFLSGAWPLPFLAGKPPAAYPFVPHDPQTSADANEGARLLDQSLIRFAPDQLVWLHTKIWQRMNDREVSFEAVGSLHLAPNGCARLEMDLDRRGSTSRQLFVSDGHAYAQETQVGDGIPALQSDHAPKVEGDERRAFLLQHGCGGPCPIVKELRQRLTNASVRRGSVNERELIEIRGDLSPGNVPETQQLKPRATVAAVYLDAATLWPQRIEWRANAKSHPLLEIEWRNARINHPLEQADCVKLYTYTPQP